jgi:cbb3-type cytochrome oxidase subunit 3
MRALFAAFGNWLAYLRHVLRRRAKAAADNESDPFIYPHS